MGADLKVILPDGMYYQIDSTGLLIIYYDNKIWIPQYEEDGKFIGYRANSKMRRIR